MLAAGLAVPAGAAAAKPNLRVSSLSEPPAEVIEGSGFEVTETTVNRGGRRAQPSTTRYYLSTDTLKDDEDPMMEGDHHAVPRLKPRKSDRETTLALLPITMEASAQRYHVIACADDDGVVREKNEADNCRASSGQFKVVTLPAEP